VNTKKITYLHPVPLQQVKIEKGFWEERQTKNRETTIPAIYDKMEETGRIKSWELDPNREKPKFNPVVHMFWDSDTGKWLESVGYSLATHPDPDLQKIADDLINAIEKAQLEDGYLNTYFPVVDPDGQWKDLRDWHEMYNAGHLIEGAVAYFQATGQRKMLDVLIRFADHIDERFGKDDGKKRGYPGHPELELALVKLYRETGEKRYLDLATYFINERGQDPSYFDIEANERGENREDFWAQTYRYCQAHAPIREHEGATGHSVRACYLYAGIADVALETDNAELLEVSRLIWDDLTQHQMYVTGGLGPAITNEGFTFAYDFPTETAYAETCASIALAFWAHRMFHLDPNSRYIDVMELAIYNGSLSGVSYEGDEFFYANPLASYPNVNPYEKYSGILTDQYYRRSEWFYCPCCPPNLSRLVASIGEYTYSQAGNRVYAHLYHDNTVSLDINGQSIKLEQSTNYPWDETINFTIHTDEATQFELALRIPKWCYSHHVSINGEAQSVTSEKGYIVLSRKWSEGDNVELTLSMPVERIASHPEVRQAAGQIALQRGPIIYCLEQVDNGARLANVVIPDSVVLESSFDENLFNGVTVIMGDALRVELAKESVELYRHRSQEEVKHTPFTFRAIPYYLWANREPGEMRVWIRSD
jgi:uncharacterized protein